jgi:dienelactone hydrolase
MTEILLFHHARGLTPGVLEFAERLRDAGHTVHTPDLYEGHTFDDLEEGIAFAKETGFATIGQRGLAAADGLPDALVYAGFSLGVPSAQALAQTRPGSRGALLYHGAFPTEEFEKPWPDGVPLQIHVMADDELGDVEFCQGLADEVKGAELFLYPGSGHLFADPGSVDYDPAAARLLTDRSLEFLHRLG